MTTATRWALVFGVLLLAGVAVALPLSGGGEGPGGRSEGAGEQLSAARAEAGLRPCPESRGSPENRLAGVTATCLADGSTVDVGAVLSGEPTLVNVWATWCQPCREELPLLQEYASSPDAVRVVTVQTESSQADGLALLTELGVTLPTIYDAEGAAGPVRTALRVPRALPASYVVWEGGVEFVGDPRVFTSVAQVHEAVRRVVP